MLSIPDLPIIALQAVAATSSAQTVELASLRAQVAQLEAELKRAEEQVAKGKEELEKVKKVSLERCEWGFCVSGMGGCWVGCSFMCRIPASHLGERVPSCVVMQAVSTYPGNALAVKLYVLVFSFFLSSQGHACEGQGAQSQG
jgi:hypothetical protein